MKTMITKKNFGNMKSINNKTNKPFISVGYDKTGNVTFNVDMNKVNKMDIKRISEVVDTLNNVIGIVKNKSNKPNQTKQNLEIVVEFCLRNNTRFPNVVELDDLIAVEMLIKNNVKLAAVKKFKEVAGCGLKDGKDFIEFYAEKLKKKFSYETNHKFYYETP